jgi:adenylate cyclase
VTGLNILRSWLEREALVPLTAVGIAALLALALPRLVPFSIVSHFADDILQAHFAIREPQDDAIVIISISESTLSGLVCRSPIDRLFLSQLLAQLEAAGTRAIGLDILLDMPTRPDADRALREQVLQAQIPVVLITAHAATPLAEAQRRYLGAFVTGLEHGYANLVKERLDDAVRWHEPRFGQGELSFPAKIAQALGVEAPQASFEIAWHGRPDDATGPFPIYPAETVSLLPAGWLMGKIALVGAVLADNDRHRTPLSVLGQNAPGVEIQAHVLSQLLDHRSHARIAPATEFALSLGLALLGGLLGSRRLAPPLQVAAAGIGLGAYAGLVVWAIARAGLLMPLVGGSLAWLTSIGGAVSLSLWHERAERRVWQSLFARHVSTPVADQIWRERRTFMAGGRPKPQELTATILFSDIEGFSTVAEQLGPARLMSWLETYMERMVSIVTDHRGIVLRFIGDGLLAAYGVPLARTSPQEIAADAVAAVRSALAMAGAAVQLQAEFAARGLPAVHVRVGIQTGPIVVGSLGGAKRLEYALVGDTVVTASRLEQLCKTLRGPASEACTIIVGDATRECLGDKFRLDDIGQAPLKGKAHLVQIYKLLGEK